MVIVIGSLLPRPEHFEQLLALSLEHVRRSRAEPGCLAHAVHRDAENALRLVFVERWQDSAALAAHFAVPESGAFVERASELASEPPTIHVFEAAPLDLTELTAS